MRLLSLITSFPNPQPPLNLKRVRDKETGELVLSDAAKNYHPGQGVYRSAYKNAMRMARTEINAAYLRAEIESYQSNPLVTGFEVKLSGNHTTTLPNGKVVHLTDICDKLAGKYPKTFMFTGWHPQCRCYIVPITIRDAELDRQLSKTGEVNTDDKQITQVPANMQQWLDDNQSRIDGAKHLPPFIEQNKELIEPAKEPEPKNEPNNYNASVYSESEILTPTEIKDISEVQRVVDDIANKHPEYFKKGYTGVVAVSQKEKYMFTDMHGKISVNFATDKNGYNAGNCLISAINKIKQHKALNKDEEYSIESLWHEILHNKSNNTTVLPNIDDIDKGFTRSVAETVNQLCARHTYKNFLSEIGGKALHTKWVLEDGHGYKSQVANLRLLLNQFAINEPSFVKKAEKLLMQDYSNFDIKIANLIKTEYSGNRDIIYFFNRIELNPKTFKAIIKSQG